MQGVEALCGYTAQENFRALTSDVERRERVRKFAMQVALVNPAAKGRKQSNIYEHQVGQPVFMGSRAKVPFLYGLILLVENNPTYKYLFSNPNIKLSEDFYNVLAHSDEKDFQRLKYSAATMAGVEQSVLVCDVQNQVDLALNLMGHPHSLLTFNGADEKEKKTGVWNVAKLSELTAIISHVQSIKPGQKRPSNPYSEFYSAMQMGMEQSAYPEIEFTNHPSIWDINGKSGWYPNYPFNDTNWGTQQEGYPEILGADIPLSTFGSSDALHTPSGLVIVSWDVLMNGHTDAFGNPNNELAYAEMEAIAARIYTDVERLDSLVTFG